MIDRSYQQALEAAGPPHHVLLGPLACKGCGKDVEWAGVTWLEVGTTTRHSCPPLGRRQVPARLYPALPPARADQAHLMGWMPVLNGGVVSVIAGALVLAILATLGGLWLLAQLMLAVSNG